MSYEWADCDRGTVSQRYDRLAKYLPVFDRLLFLPSDLRRKAVDSLALRRGDVVLDIGCGTGANLAHLHNAVGTAGQVYGIDISRGMLREARAVRDANRWRNVDLTECDALDFAVPRPLDGALFSLSYNTMPHHRGVLHKMWEQLRPGGRLVIMDAKLPPGEMGRLILPFSIWLMRRTMLGNPLIRPWEEVTEIADRVEMEEFLFGSYYICRAVKPAPATTKRSATAEAAVAVA